MKIENREALDQLKEYAQQVISVSQCRILICAGTGCLAGGSAEIYHRMCELVKGSRIFLWNLGRKLRMVMDR